MRNWLLALLFLGVLLVSAAWLILWGWRCIRGGAALRGAGLVLAGLVAMCVAWYWLSFHDVFGPGRKKHKHRPGALDGRA